MTIQSLLLRLAFGLLTFLSPGIAHAQGNMLMGGGGGGAISAILMELLARAMPLWIIIGVVTIVVAGFSLMISQDEGRLGKAKATIGAVVIGGIVITIGPIRWISFIYTGIPGLVVPNTGSLLGAEAIGVSDWVATIVAVIGLITVIIALIQAALSFGGDEGAYTKVRTALLHLIIGLLVIAAAFIIRSVFFTVHEPSPLLAFILQKISIILGVILTIAVAVLVYAGVRMILSVGKEDQFGAAKSLAIRVVTGIGVILLSFVMIWTVYTVLT